MCKVSPPPKVTTEEIGGGSGWSLPGGVWQGLFNCQLLQNRLRQSQLYGRLSTSQKNRLWKKKLGRAEREGEVGGGDPPHYGTAREIPSAPKAPKEI